MCSLCLGQVEQRTMAQWSPGDQMGKAIDREEVADWNHHIHFYKKAVRSNNEIFLQLMVMYLACRVLSQFESYFPSCCPLYQ